MTSDIDDLKRRVARLENQQHGDCVIFALLFGLAFLLIVMMINFDRLHYATGVPKWPKSWQPSKLEGADKMTPRTPDAEE